MIILYYLCIVNELLLVKYSVRDAPRTEYYFVLFSLFIAVVIVVKTVYIVKIVFVGLRVRQGFSPVDARSRSSRHYRVGRTVGNRRRCIRRLLVRMNVNNFHVFLFRLFGNGIYDNGLNCGGGNC